MRRLLADIVLPEHLHDPAGRRNSELLRNQLCLEDDATGEIHRVEIFIASGRCFNVRKQARQRLLLAESMYRFPVAAAQSGDHGEHRLARQVISELSLPSAWRALE